MRTRILITGKSGQVGGALVEELSGSALVYAPSSAELDLRDEDSVRKGVRVFRPDWIVNAAAYTAVDQAESERELAFKINAQAPRILAEEAALAEIPLLHFSTDYVFDGSKPGAYVEQDPTGPLNVYGQSKRAGEEAIARCTAPFLIFRTSWVYGATGKNFLRTILKAAREREQLRIVADQRGAPTWSRELARMVAFVIEERSAAAARDGSRPAEAVRAVQGVYHASGGGETTWYGFAQAALAALRVREPESQIAVLEAIATAEYPTAARRPLNSCLDCTKLQETLGWQMPGWRDSLAAVLDEMRTG